MTNSEGCTQKILTLFDRKSQSTLEEVSLLLPSSEKAVQRTLLRSRESLRILRLDVQHEDQIDSDLATLVYKLPRLEDFRLTDIFEINEGEGIPFVQPRRMRKSNCLEILWIWSHSEVLDLNNHLFENLTSLSIAWVMGSSDWRKILEPPSKTLKHLDLWMENADEEHYPLAFPNLQVLEIGADPCFPSWMMAIPETSTIILLYNWPLSGLPSITRLMVQLDESTDEDWKDLDIRCPLLKELRVRNEEMKGVKSTLSFLAKRKRNVEAQVKVDGIQMTPLKTLVVSFKLFEDFLPQLRELVEELIDLDTVRPGFEKLII